MQTIFHHAHFGMFHGPHEAIWIRKMSGEIDADILTDVDFDDVGLLELATALTAEMGSLAAVFGVGVEIGEEDLEKVPVAVYYYIMVDAGRTALDPVCIDPSRVDEDIVALPEWFHAEIKMARDPEERAAH
jgi:hypothetical protein